ncbi:MAG: hypothetical protein JOZ62_07915 [Acidobacteriaceae bacterium]|nr:hypothetical protein [Acidobacteriaceae bacterium]
MWHLRSRNGEQPLGNGSRRLEFLAVLGTSRDQETVAEFASESKWDFTIVSTLEAAHARLHAALPAVVLLDRELLGEDWRPQVCLFARPGAEPGIAGLPASCVILASPVMDDYLFDELIKQGGFDLIAKPVRADELRRIGSLAVAYWKDRHRSPASG